MRLRRSQGEGWQGVRELIHRRIRVMIVKVRLAMCKSVCHGQETKKLTIRAWMVYVP